MACDVETLENIRSEILETCRKQQGERYLTAILKAKEKVKDFLALKHPEEFVLECTAMDLFNNLYQNDATNLSWEVRLWAKSVRLFTNYIVKKSNPVLESRGLKSVSSLWDAFVVHSALQHLGPIGTPQVIRSEGAAGAFSSIRVNHTLVKNKHWELSDMEALKVEIWKWAYGHRRKQHRELVGQKLKLLMHDLRQLFAKGDKCALVSTPAQESLTYLKPLSTALSLVHKDLVIKDLVSCELADTKCEEDTNKSSDNKQLRKKNQPHFLKRKSTSTTDDRDRTCSSKVMTFEETDWPSWVAIGAQVRYKKFPTHTYVIKSIVGSRRVLQLKPSDQIGSVKCVPPQSVVIKSPSEIEDVAIAAEPLFAVNVPMPALERGSPTRKVMSHKAARALAINRNPSPFLKVLAGSGETNLRSRAVARALEVDKNASPFLNILANSGCYYQPKPRVIRKRARPFEESFDSETEDAEQESPPSLEILDLDIRKEKALAKPRENPIVFTDHSKQRNPFRKEATGMTGESYNPLDSSPRSSYAPKSLPSDLQEKDLEYFKGSPRKRIRPNILLTQTNYQQIAKTEQISDDAEHDSSWSKLLPSLRLSEATKSTGKRTGFWTKAERTALWDGLMEFQPSGFKNGVRRCWSYIKRDPRWRKALARRTTVQMKDKARPWIKSGALERELKKRQNRARTS